MPTILELAGVETAPLLMQGDSLVELIKGREMPYWENRLLVSEEPTVMSKDPLSLSGSLFFRKWHILSSRVSRRKLLPRVLRTLVYDFHEDRSENRPLYSFLGDFWLRYKFVSTLEELQSNNIAAWKKWTGGGGAKSYVQDPEELKRLRGLGYIQ